MSKGTVMLNSGWAEDDSGLMEANNISLENTTLNEGAKSRAKWISNSKVLTFCGRILFDFHGVQRLIPNNVSLYVRMIPASTSIFVIDYLDTPAKVHLQAAKLYIAKVQLSSAMQNHQAMLLKRSGLEFPCRRYHMRTKILQKGEQYIDWSPYINCNPRRLFIWQTTLKAYNGANDQNTFNFQIFKLNKLQVYLNDLSLPTNVPMAVKDNLGLVYLNSASSINNEESWDITYKDYKEGFFIAVIDLTKDHSANSDYDSTKNSATLRILGDYTSTLDESIVVFCMIEYDSVLTINNGGQCKWEG